MFGDEPDWLLFYELVQRANAGRRAGRDREAVIDYTTAGEVFITLLIESAGRRRWDEQRVLNLVNGPFADRAEHLCRLLGKPHDRQADDFFFAMWWKHAYQQRIGVVHRGAGSIPPYSDFARMGLVRMLADVREALRETDDLADIADLTQWGTLHDGDENVVSAPAELPPVRTAES